MTIAESNKNVLSIINQCIKDYDKNLKDKKIMFIFKEKNKKINYTEMYFPTTAFNHLTGVVAFDKKGKKLNSYEFYNSLKKGNISPEDIKLKDMTVYKKMQVLPLLMKIDKNAKMIGDFLGNGIVLQTDKLVGNVRGCIGFKYNNEQNYFIPNTALEKDIREITTETNNIVAVVKGNINDKKYKEITYLNDKYNISDILSEYEINRKVDIENIYSGDLKIDEKIIKYHYSLQTENIKKKDSRYELEETKNENAAKIKKENQEEFLPQDNFYKLHKDKISSFYKTVYGINFNFTKEIFDEDVEETKLYLVENNKNIQFLVLNNPFPEEEIYRVCMNLENGKIYIDEEADKVLDLQSPKQREEDDDEEEE